MNEIEKHKKYLDRSIPFKYNANGHLIHDCFKNPDRSKYKILRCIQPNKWMLCTIWISSVYIPINSCPWCRIELDMSLNPEGEKYTVILNESQSLKSEKKNQTWNGTRPMIYPNERKGDF